MAVAVVVIMTVFCKQEVLAEVLQALSEMGSGMREENKLTVQECSANEIQGKANAAHNQDQLWLLYTLQRYESFDGLKEDADAQGKQEDAVEEGA